MQEQTSKRPLRVFLCYSKSDRDLVRELYLHLVDTQVDPWLDEKRILPGQDWESEIRKAVRDSDVVIVCLSKQATSKRGYVQKEIKTALDVADKQPQGTIFIIPVRLELCVVPARLSRYQWVDLFEEGGYKRLIAALQERAIKLNLQMPITHEGNVWKIDQQRTRTAPLEPQRDLTKSESASSPEVQVRRAQGWVRRNRTRIVAAIAAFIGVVWLIIQVVANIAGILGFFGISAPGLFPQPTATPVATVTQTPKPFVQPTIYSVGVGSTLGYSKQHAIVRDSKGTLHVIISPDGQQQIAESVSSDNGKTWSTPKIIPVEQDKGQEASIAVDSADRIHMVYGPWDGGPVYYRVFDGQKWSDPQYFTSAFGRNIAVDTANHPHIVFSTVDVGYLHFDGQQWVQNRSAIKACWHPDIAIDHEDVAHVVCNDGFFYPEPAARVYYSRYDGISWSPKVKLTNGPFWSGGTAITIDSKDVKHVVWVSATTKEGGKDTVYYSSDNDGNWYPYPFAVGDVGTSAGQVGKESPAICVDKNDVVYVFWRGITPQGKATIFMRALGAFSSPVVQGWSDIYVINDPESSTAWWPSVSNNCSRDTGADVVWTATVGTQPVVKYMHVVWP